MCLGVFSHNSGEAVYLKRPYLENKAFLEPLNTFFDIMIFLVLEQNFGRFLVEKIFFPSESKILKCSKKGI